MLATLIDLTTGGPDSSAWALALALAQLNTLGIRVTTTELLPAREVAQYSEGGQTLLLRAGALPSHQLAAIIDLRDSLTDPDHESWSIPKRHLVLAPAVSPVIPRRPAGARRSISQLDGSLIPAQAAGPGSSRACRQ